MTLTGATSVSPASPGAAAGQKAEEPDPIARAPRAGAEEELQAETIAAREAESMTRLDCRKLSVEGLNALLPKLCRWEGEAPYQDVKILDFTGNKNFSDAHFLQVFKASKLVELHIQDTSVSPERQALAEKYNKAFRANKVLGLSLGLFKDLRRNEVPVFRFFSSGDRTLQALIERLKAPQNAEHCEAVEWISFWGNKALTDGLLTQIIPYLPNLTHLNANYTQVTKRPDMAEDIEFWMRKSQEQPVWVATIELRTGTDCPNGDAY